MLLSERSQSEISPYRMIPTVQLSGKTDYGDDKMIGDCLSPGTGRNGQAECKGYLWQ